MRILHVSSLWPPNVLGGAELYAARLAAEQASSGHDVGAATLGVDGELVVGCVPAWPYRLDRFEKQSAWRKALFHARDVYDPLAAHVLGRTIESFRPDVVHSHGVTGMSPSVLALPAALGVASVHTLHDHSLLCVRTTLARADGALCDRRCSRCRALGRSRELLLRRRYADVVIAPSDAIARTHAEAWPWLAARIVHLQHPADEPEPGRPVRPTRADGRVVFGFLGHLVAAKGIRTLLAAFASLPAQTELVVAGSGELAGELASTSPAGVRFEGWVEGDSREAFFAAIDCLVVPSEVPEAAGLVVAEARQRGLPVIAAAIGALPEYVDPASRPLLFARGDAEALGRSLAAFVADRGRYAPTGPLPATWQQHAADVLLLYERARALRSEGRLVAPREASSGGPG